MQPFPPGEYQQRIDKTRASMISGTGEFSGDYSSICPMLPTGVGTSTPHLTWTDEPFKNGEATILEPAGVRRRYHRPMARTVHLGKPPQRLADTAEIVIEGLANAIAAAKPGGSLRRGGSGLAPRHRQELPHRLFHRPQLSSRLG